MAQTDDVSVTIHDLIRRAFVGKTFRFLASEFPNDMLKIEDLDVEVIPQDETHIARVSIDFYVVDRDGVKVSIWEQELHNYIVEIPEEELK